MHARRLFGICIILLLGLAFVAGCGGEGGDGDGDDGEGVTHGANGTTVDVRLSEWAVEPSPDTVPAGPVTFNIENVGTTPHNFMVIQTDLAPDALPVNSDQAVVDETAVDVRVGGSTLAAGASEERSVDLEAGSYVLICNVPTHYELGMRAAFTVE